MDAPDAPADVPADVPAGPLPRALARARVHDAPGPERSWTPLGTVDAGVLGAVDGAGSVRVGTQAWTLDWWIGAEDRWHYPSQEVTVRQRAVDAAPVVETALRVPGGDVLHRAYVAQVAAGDWRGPAVVVEVQNVTAVPVALALVVRPVTLDGPGRVGRVEVRGADVLVDGRPAVLLSREPARVAAGRSGEVAARLAAGDDAARLGAVDDPDGDLEVAVVVPLAHTAVARLVLPVVTADDRRGGPAGPSPASPWDAPGAAAVAAGWSVHGGDRVRVTVPEPEWDDALAWASRLLLLTGPDEVGACLDRRRVPPAGPSAAMRAAVVAEALARLGAVDGCDAIAGALASSQRLGGEARLGDRSDGSVALLHAVAPVLAGPFGAARLDDLLAPAAVAVRRLRRGRVPDGLAPSAVRALRTLAPVLAAAGQPGVAEDAVGAAAALGGTDAPRGAARPGGPAGGTDPGTWSTLARALAVRVELARGAGTDELRALWDGHASSGRSDAEATVGAGPTGVAEVVVPAGALGFDPAELAARTCALLDLLVADGELGPDLCPVWPEAWDGAQVEAHGLVTPWGSVSFAVRWHGGRPALLWEIEPPPGLAPVTTAPRVRASGLDPRWQGTGWSGEGLLAGSSGVEGASPGLPGEGDSFT